ncbi:MAG: hypothetical protein ACRCS6_05925, partial [Turicibacter sp.]
TEKSKIFDLLYGLEEDVEEVEIEEVKPVEVKPVEVEVEKEVVTKVPTPVETVENTTVYSHFADGESLMKIIFIQEEEITVTELCEKYDVPVHWVQGVESPDCTLVRGDRVMINYGNQQ